jgi:glycosyltransferase involved in cell wall biosynthesis
MVFVHMNKEYIALGWLVWFLLGKKIVFWHNHKIGDFMARLAGFLSHKIFYTSPDSFFANNPKAEIMPVGIDENLFKKNPNILALANSFLSIGRISPVKKLEVLIEATKILSGKRNDFIVSIVGGAPSQDVGYFEKIKKDSSELQAKEIVKFINPVPNDKAPEIYQGSGCLINTTISGSMDKTIFEAMACEMPVLTSNIGMKKFWPEDLCGKLLFKENNSGDLASKMENLLAMSESERGEIGGRLRQIVVEKHSLRALSEKLFFNFKSI